MHRILTTHVKSVLAVTIMIVAAGTGFMVWHYRHPLQLRTLVQEAQMAAQSGDLAAAEQICDEVLARQSDHLPALRLRSELAMRESNFELALTFLRRIGDSPASTGAAARYYEGLALWEFGRAREAERMFLKSLELEPTAAQPELKLRELYMLQLRRDDLRSFLRSRRPLRSWTLKDLLDFIVVGHVPKYIVGLCIDRVKLFAQTDPEDTHSQLALACYYATESRFEESGEIAGTLLRRHPQNPKARALLADALLGQNRIAEARTTLNPQPLETVSDAWLWHSLGRLAMAEGDYGRAAGYLQESLRLAPGDPSALYQLGLTRGWLGSPSASATLTRCGKELALLVDVARRILRQQEDERDARKVRGELVTLGELMLDCELYEDATYCLEFVVRDEVDNQQARELYAQAQDQLARHRAHRGEPGRLSMTDYPTATHASPSLNRQTSASGFGRPALRFEDVASQVGISFEYFPGDTGKKYLFETLGGGVAAFDFDGDGWPDLFFPQGCRLPVNPNDRTYVNALFRNQSGQTFDNVTELAGLDHPGYGIGCAAGDYDNDGFADLLVTRYGSSSLYHNNGDGTFVAVSFQTGVVGEHTSTSAAFADLNRDGDLDLYIVNYLANVGVCPSRQGKVHACHPSMFEAEQDVLLENSGDGRFHDVTERCGIKVPDGKGLGIVVADFDNDGWPDIYVANDTTPNFLFHNLGGAAQRDGNTRLSFEECALSAGAALGRDGQAQAGMGIACADFDNNDYLDLYVTNYYHETNALYLNQGHLLFVDSVKPASLVAATNPLLGFGTQAIDVDLDGELDLFVTNGHIDDYRDVAPGMPWRMPAKVYQNTGNLEFEDVSATAGGFFHGTHLGRGVARLDWNRDTRPDLVVVHQNEPAALLENVTATASHRVVVEFIGTASNRDGVNTRYWITAGAKRRLFEVIGGDGYLATNERRQIIGLGDASSLDSFEVLWPSGRRDRWMNLPADSVIRLVEGHKPGVRPIELAN